MFIIIPLPDRDAIGLAHQIDSVGNGCLVCTYHGWNGAFDWFLESFLCRGTAGRIFKRIRDTLCRARTVGDHEDAMYMIGHDYKGA